MITMDRKYQTRGSPDWPSRPVRIMCVDMITPGSYCVLGLVLQDFGSFQQEDTMVWTKEGWADVTQRISADLVLVPEAQP